MENIINEGFSIIEKSFTIKELDTGEFKKIFLFKILPFYSKTYSIEGLGILSKMSLNLGFISSYIFNITPYERDLPVFTIDFIKLGKLNREPV